MFNSVIILYCLIRGFTSVISPPPQVPQEIQPHQQLHEPTTSRVFISSAHVSEFLDQIILTGSARRLIPWPRSG